MSADIIRVDYDVLEDIRLIFQERGELHLWDHAGVQKAVSALANGGWEGEAATAYMREMEDEVLPALRRLGEGLLLAARTTSQIIRTVREAEERAAQLFSGQQKVLFPQPSDVLKSEEHAERKRGTIPAKVTDLPLTAEEWQARALEAAGIDPTTWIPSAGFSANQEAIKAVYDYYAILYLENPEMIWAGMARMTGQRIFYPGFLEVNAAIDLIESYREHNPMTLFGFRYGESEAASLRFLENKFVSMNKEIFMDMAWQHEAYRHGGIELMRELEAQTELSPRLLRAWEDIDSGNSRRVEEGNSYLLYREQHDIIQNDYNEIRQGIFWLDGWVISTGLSMFAVPPTSDGHTFLESVPFGDLAHFDDRWQWIETDMLPNWVNLSQNHPEQARVLIEEPLNDSATSAFAAHIWRYIWEDIDGWW